jgi:transposase
VKEGPQSCGLDRAHWTDEELATSLYQTQGITVQRTALRDFCPRHNMRPYRPTSRYLRGDPEEQRRAQAEREAVKKKRRAGPACS